MGVMNSSPPPSPSRQAIFAEATGPPVSGPRDEPPLAQSLGRASADAILALRNPGKRDREDGGGRGKVREEEAWREDAFPPAAGAWTSGLFSCDWDISSCCLVAWCPCVAVGRIAELASSGSTNGSFACCCWLAIMYLSQGACGFVYAQGFRAQLRIKYDLPPEPCDDLLVHLFCPMCALCQEYRELQNRGWKLHESYAKNMQSSLSGVPPPMQAMGR